MNNQDLGTIPYNPENKLSWKKILLIALTVCILGPIVFAGSCFPIGYLGFAIAWDSSSILGIILFYASFLIGILVAIFVCYKIIKKIKNYYKEDVTSTS